MITTNDNLHPRLLRGVGDEPITTLAAHHALHGPFPHLDRSTARETVITTLDKAGLRGHGGASFPTARKLRAVASRRAPEKYVVVNATEGEPASRKDRVLLRQAPHLVLDGAALAAAAIGAKDVFIALKATDVRSAASLEAALEQRAAAAATQPDPRFHVIDTPDLYLAGQETALVNYLGTGEVLPTLGPRPFERGIRRRPTLVQNAETVAHVALIMRHGADWFRQTGTAQDPGSALVTLSGAVERAGVYEIPHGLPLSELLAGAAPTEPVQAILIGGHFGSWLRAADIAKTRLAPTELRAQGASLGAGVIVALGESACPVAETTRVAHWFEAHGAGQCGPCVNGLGAIAESLEQLQTGTADPVTYADLTRWARDLPGRGACQHPDGAVRFVLSALDVFAAEFDDHAAHGSCDGCTSAPVLPLRLPAVHARA
jgi:NADH:ubiquinone oxidoreductase subunit F (NADH-binding)